VEAFSRWEQTGPPRREEQRGGRSDDQRGEDGIAGAEGLLGDVLVEDEDAEDRPFEHGRAPPRPLV
jgi:hypothetical protein